MWVQEHDTDMEVVKEPRGVVISPSEPVEPECDPYRVADEIYCNNLHTYCTSTLDVIYLRIESAGE